MVASLLVPQSATAQAIGGTVTDSTAAVLPGVTVEARSPALIEQVRSVVTDGAGQYLIIALEPGTYTVTYGLPGFSTLVREGIELSTGFTATIDIQLSVGDVAETVTVSGASPVARAKSRKASPSLPTSVFILPCQAKKSGWLNSEE